jgi:RNA polymerase sigma-70 factor, ECF subfamily
MRLVDSRPAGGPPPGGESLDLGDLYRAHAAVVWRWARRLLGDERDADDVLHEVFLVAHRKLPEFEPHAQVTTWLYGITVRLVQHRRRKERWMRWLTGDPARSEDQLAARGPSPLDALEQRRTSELVYRILDSLRERDRTVLILFEMEGLSGAEIAAITGQSVPSVWVRLHRARGRFLQAMTRAISEVPRVGMATPRRGPT